jgi:CheY-like chemotaxis protein
MKKKILFIDDDPTILLISEMMLKDLGYDVITADGGVSGIELLKTNDIDLILLDLMMADIYGLDVLKYIKEKEEFKNIPVVIQSGIKDSDEINKAYKLGASYVLLKPYNQKDLKDIIGILVQATGTDLSIYDKKK